MTPDDIARKLEEFHGHLGPFAAVGWRMGQAARTALGAGKLRARVFAGPAPPISCIVDGVQVSTSCTLGKGNIWVINAKKPEAEFTSESGAVWVALRNEVADHIAQTMSRATERSLAMEILNMPEERLLEVKRQ
ncbi:MAG: formylmethanofuran dehydrogenase subunit E family protein [Euryarchaeota archaeon]|nr:formylmethanofuran dehydrogenase subunit E family protein [Euryarchaeota archaeon]